MRAVFVAVVVAFLVSLFGTPTAIRYFTKLRAAQPIRTTAPVGPVPPHEGKRGTPTMGGVVFIVATVIAYVVGHLALMTLPERQMAQITPTITALVLLGLFVFCGAVGFIDDLLKVRRRNSGGLSKRGKLLGQLVVGAAFGVVAMSFKSTNDQTVGSDLVIVTDDNPRTEDPAAIRAAVLAGAGAFSGGGAVVEVAGRREAIAEAVRRAAPGDVVAVLGKGHERGQEVNGEILPFDDRIELARALESVGQR